MTGPYCDTCGANHCDPCANRGQNKADFVWGFGGENNCELRARAHCKDVRPLNLCKWLCEHETDTSMSLIPDGLNSYIRFCSERDLCGEENPNYDDCDKIYICDMLSLSQLNCLGDVCAENPEPCSLLVFDPCCGDPICEACEEGNKWTAYKIPDANGCIIEPDENGYYNVLTKDDCGCIVECGLLPSDTVAQYVLRDSVPNDPDWPFIYGNYTEDIQIELASHVPDWFGKYDLEVTIEYGFGIQHPTVAPECNFKSNVVPTFTGGIIDTYNKSIVNQMNNPFPWGSWETQTARVILVPKGKDLYLHHTVELRADSSFPNVYTTEFDGQQYDGTGAAKTNSSRLHALTVTVKPIRRIML